ncbi:MAG: Gfo/Idh/MocA family oxidoreductase [Kiritimatiellae bacterium]|nr:Gfo/Idh/MocA family oxidoreductase [Kiritimatiellia bacterium]
MITSRRTFLAGAAAVGALPLFNIGCAGFGQGRRAQLAQGAKIRIAIVGCGDWGRTLLTRAGLVGGCEVVALCEPDAKAIAKLKKQCAKTWGREALDAAKVYPDYRVMFDEMGDSLDAVFIATPNHHHALPALLAIRHGVNVYVEKPMAHTMEEVIRIGEEGRKAGVVVRVGNKGHNISHRPTLAKYLKEGVIGDVTEVFSFSDRPNTMFRRPHAIPVPEGMDWDLWCGGSPVCEPYGEEDGRVGLHPHDWHSWIDYGNGSIGNMGTHVLDAPFQTMDMWKVKPSKIEVRDVKWGCPGAWNARGTMDFTIPARDGWGEIVLHWNDGVVDGVDISSKFMTGCYNRVYKREHTNFPPELVELEKKWGVKKPIPAFGTVFVGTKGMIYEEFHRTLRLFPEGGRIADIPVPDKGVLNLEERKIVAEFLSAVRGNPGPVNTGLDFSIPLAKTLMLANMLAFAGKGTYKFDGAKTDSAAANARFGMKYRKGWETA